MPQAHRLLDPDFAKFTWEKENLLAEGPTRKKYIEALRQADKHDYTALAAFVRS